MLKQNKFSIVLIFTFFVSFFTYSNTGLHNTIIDFNNSVIDFSETGLMDNVRSGELTQITPLDLEIGSIFIDVDGVAKKVVNITQSGNEIYIDTVKPELREVFEFYDIPEQTVTLTIGDHLLMDNAPFDSSLIPDSRAKGTMSLEFEKKLGDDNASVTLGAEASLTVEVSVGARLPYTMLDTKGTWKFWKWKIKYYQGFAKGDIEYDLSLKGKIIAEATMSKELNIPIFALTTGPGIDVGAGFFSNSSITGSITLTDELEFTLKGNAGAKCNLDGFLIYCYPTNIEAYGDTEFLVKNTLTLEAQVELKQKMYLGTWVKIFGFAIVEADAGGGPYLDFNAMITGWLQYSTKTKFSSNWSYSGSGEIGVFAEINASVFDGKWGGEIWAKKFPIYTISGEGGGKTTSVQFDGDGATTPCVPESINLSPSETNIESLPIAPIRNGYIFEGWFTEKKGESEPFTEETQVTSDTIVYAKWVADATNNLALKKEVKVSSTTDAPVTGTTLAFPESLTNGLKSIFDQWLSKTSSSEEWIVIDLEEPTDFRTIKLFFIDTAYNYKAEWSTDSTTWNLIPSDCLLFTETKEEYIRVLGGGGSKYFDVISHTISLPAPVTGRYIKISAQNILGLGEVEVYNGLSSNGSGGGG
ncbi:MAG: hypothetical protein A2015_10935 [Spirochaetes bacterium GWF1_31_7]|nr:MAG: hypothetical protein A2Y30_13070 [Spirochaetes bacterium GWE1_32_154]OHD48372.1 MAG: hypothetical protein A2015_10935 [Spirochaetes bacterium GWF1_31_7]OHD50465.1 MAG: hypothetical protein A2Y29_11115 [Spirochaetes bacterium GWE2_31_10]OHD82666.1 MAG: hypothetical protein A2355_15205 [Spirochaetes bacterium RIFOXYB1_FULL_32_8]HBD93224.1 hypothetical protein [Spirochaetia bacterium]